MLGPKLKRWFSKVRKLSRKALAHEFQGKFFEIYEMVAKEQANGYSADQQSIGKRALKNVCLSYLMELDDADVAREHCLKQFHNSNNMTDTIAALASLSHRNLPETEQVLLEFYQKWKDNALVVDKWLTIQGRNPLWAF